MSTSDQNAIDEKKGENTEFKPDFKGFIKNYLISIIFTIGVGVFIVGTIGLYTTKVAQSNILPDDVELAPFTVIDRIVNDIYVDVNIMKPSIFSDSSECSSQKAVFNSQEYLDSFKRSFLCYIKSKANPDGGLFSNAPLYFSHVYENLIAKNFLATNTIFLYLSQLPESLIMILFGLFGIAIWLLMYFFNMCISIFYHFVSIPQLFRDISDDKWESNKDISFIRIMKLIMFFFIWVPVGFISATLSPLFFTLYGIFAPLFATYQIKQTNKKNNVFDFIKDTFVYKKLLFFILATVSLFSNGYKYLGPASVIGISIAVLFAYFMGLYSNEIPEPGVEGFTNKIRQNVRQAKVEEVNYSNAKLVEICKQIPEIDEKMEKIIQNGMFRPLVGGNGTISNGTISNGTISNGQQGGTKKHKKFNFRIV